jgi:serine phosphatase RsbU (regulator of sigma subunit)
MVLWRQATNSCHIVNPNGLALGVDRGPLFERCVREQIVQLAPGDRFVIYTDGIVEAMDENKELFGVRRFYRIVQTNATSPSSEFISKLIRSVDEHKGNAPQHDDITIITGRLAGATRASEPAVIERSTPSPGMTPRPGPSS